MKRIYYEGREDETGEVCEIGDDLLPGFTGECGNDASYSVRDTVTGIQWMICEEHRDEIKAAGIAS